jgi:hypothetical protein
MGNMFSTTNNNSPFTFLDDMMTISSSSLLLGSPEHMGFFDP